MRKAALFVPILLCLVIAGCSQSQPELEQSNPEEWTEPSRGGEPELLEEGP